MARGIVSYAAHLADKAIGITTSSATHAISCWITSYFNAPKGHAVALTLCKLLIVKSDANAYSVSDKSWGRIFGNHTTMNEIFAPFGKNTATECRLFWYGFPKSVGLGISRATLGVTRDGDV